MVYFFCPPEKQNAARAEQPFLATGFPGSFPAPAWGITDTYTRVKLPASHPFLTLCSNLK
ncbi:hypothetical protein EG028_09180 [Chitinophaga barathri]|uniref:Uncharacterized protein n=1 Tax=Chitinophaga barathri TaxID=1647451 RepID=A0A3N4MN52_9BACT|nr:hypothetical protein EG028_09180 [Chitinophaga barathri]